jgi:tetratricopeptide (TPR) repeat protein
VTSAEALAAPVTLAARRRDAVLAVVVVLGLTASVLLAQALDGRRLALPATGADDAPAIAPATARHLALGFNGLAADWYWLEMLQYIGRTIQEQARTSRLGLAEAVELDRIKAVNPRALTRRLELITALDPRFTAVYEFAAVVLPAVDADAAIALLEKGIVSNPEQWYLHQQLAYIHWQRGDYLAAADAFRRGARMTTAGWMEHFAERMERQGDDPQVARAMYGRMYEQAQDEQVRQWALKRLNQLRSLAERAAIRGVLSAFIRGQGRCPRAWTEVTDGLRAAGLAVAGPGVPLDPSGAPYLLVLTPLGCDVALHPQSTVPR